MSGPDAGTSPALTIGRIERLHWLLLAVLVLVSLVVPGLAPISLAAGGAFMGANVNLMKQLFARLVRPGAAPRVGRAIFLLTAKTCLFLGLLVLLFGRIPIDGLSFALGASVFLLAAVIGGVMWGGETQGEP